MVLEWPSQSLDLKAVRVSKPPKVAKLKQFCKDNCQLWHNHLLSLLQFRVTENQEPIFNYHSARGRGQHGQVASLLQG